MSAVTSCRSCGSGDLTEVLDLGDQRLSDFRDDGGTSPSYPLTLLLCLSCRLPQLSHTVPPTELYHPRYSFRSGVNETVVADLASVAAYAYAHARVRADRRGRGRWLDVASNDGTLLSFVPRELHRTGIDPLEQLADEARRHADRVVVDLFDPDHFRDDEFDVITAVSVFYDVDDLDAFVTGVERVLAPDGAWVIQQNYLPAMLENNSVDNISHEHLTYHSLGTLTPLLARHGLEVTDAATSTVNGGCLRTLVTRAGARPVSSSVATLAAAEEARRLGDPATYRRFADRTRAVLDDLREVVSAVTDAGRTVFVYGASTRGGTLWQAAGLTSRDLPYVVDRNPAKVGRVMTALGSPIISEDAARRDPPDYLLVGPWWLRDSFLARERRFTENGGRFIFPLPEVEVVP